MIFLSLLFVSLSSCVQYRPVYLYFTGNFRSFNITSHDYVRWMGEMHTPVQPVMHTWTTVQHEDKTWWGHWPDQKEREYVHAYLESASNPLLYSLIFEIEDYKHVKPYIPRPSENTDHLSLVDVMCAQYYTLKKVHQLAVEAFYPHDDDIIIKTRPDVRFAKTFNATRLREYFSLHPFTLFSIAQRDDTWWKSNFASDIVFITSKAAYQRMEDVDWAKWFDGIVKTNVIHASTPHLPEYVFRKFAVDFLGLDLKWYGGGEKCL